MSIIKPGPGGKLSSQCLPDCWAWFASRLLGLVSLPDSKPCIRLKLLGWAWFASQHLIEHVNPASTSTTSKYRLYHTGLSGFVIKFWSIQHTLQITEQV